MIPYSTLETPLGPLTLAWGKGGLQMLAFEDHWKRERANLERRRGEPSAETRETPPEFAQPLQGYFSGHLEALDAIPVDPSGTPFQLAVWAALRRIPVGSTMSYGQLAAAVGCKDGARAVGTANGSNPIALVIPCHRVIRGNGNIGGYGGGLWRKNWLLRHEKVAEFGDLEMAPLFACR